MKDFSSVVGVSLPCARFFFRVKAPSMGFLLAILVAGFSSRSPAQDTLVVEWKNPDGSVRVNALADAVLGDTLADGTRENLNRTYLLRRGGQYWNTVPILTTGFPLRLVGEIPGSGSDEGPAVVRLAADTSEEIHTQPLIIGRSNVTLERVRFSGADTNGNQSSYQPIQLTGSELRFEANECVFEQSNWALLAVIGAHNVLSITNCRFRNLIACPSTNQWEGRGISIWADQDSVIIENCTFFNIGFTVFQVEGGRARYLRFNHNTIVNIGRGITPDQYNWWNDAYFANNLIINAWWEGESYEDVHDPNRDARRTHAGLFTIGRLPSVYGPEEQRRIVFVKNFAYLDPRIAGKYGSPADSIVRAWFFDPVSISDYLDVYSVQGPLGGHMYVGDTVWLPSCPTGFTDYLSDEEWLRPRFSLTGATMVDSMWQNITMLRANKIPATQYVYHPQSLPVTSVWPLPESFVYSDENLVRSGTDGLPIGDLNWFPSQKAEFVCNQKSYVAAIEALAGSTGPEPDYVRIEAESGTLGGTAAVAEVSGLTYLEYNGAGTIAWHFTIVTPGQYDTQWKVHLTGRSLNGAILALDSVQFVDRAHGWGQFVFDTTLGPAFGLSNSSWIWVPIGAESVKISSDGSSATGLFTLSAGTHAISVQSGGWGDLKFSDVVLIRHDATDTIRLKPADAVFSLVTPGAEQTPWVPSRFRYVSLGEEGSITWTVRNDGSFDCYRLRVHLQNVGSPQLLNITEGETALSSFTAGTRADSQEINVLSQLFMLSNGTHELTFSGKMINVDFVDVVKGYCGGVGGEHGPPIPRFALEQNYPNPFNPATTITFSVPARLFVSLKIFDVLGREVTTILDEVLQAGAYTRRWAAGSVSTGVYFCRLKAGTLTQTRKLLLLR